MKTPLREGFCSTVGVAVPELVTDVGGGAVAPAAPVADKSGEDVSNEPVGAVEEADVLVDPDVVVTASWARTID